MGPWRGLRAVPTASANVDMLGVRLHDSGPVGRTFAPKILVRWVCSANYCNKTRFENTVCTRKLRHIDMPRKTGARNAAPKKKVGGAAESTAPVGDSGGNSEVCSPTAAGSSSTFVSPYQDSAASPISEKGVQRQPSRRGLQACLEGSSSGQFPAHPPTYAHMSTGRAVVRKKIPIIQDKEESVGGKRAPPDPLKAPAAAARNAVSAGSLRASALSATTTADDQQTQDADGQAAAPQLRFQVRTDYVAWQRWFSVRCMQPFVVCVRIVCAND